MASSDTPGSFEAMIHADRARKKNEDLANQIFGRSKAQNARRSQKEKEARSPSLASRMGVQKRHSTSGSTPTQQRSNPFNPPSRPSSTTPSQRNARASRIANEIDSGNANINAANSRPKVARNGISQGPGLSIKGTAGPFTIHASNFDPGTTEADIEAALHGDLFDEAGMNCLQSCKLVSQRPQVTFEMVFSEKAVADRIINKFNNLKADGRILRVEFVKTSAGATAVTSSRRGANSANGNVAQSIEPASEDVPMAVAVEGDMDMVEADANAEFAVTSAYDHEREAADRDRRDRDRDRDGYSSRRDDRRDDRGRDDRDRRRDDRDRDRDRERVDERDRERERDRDRDRERERDRDRDYDRRESQSQPQPQGQPRPYNGYSQGPPPYDSIFGRGRGGGYRGSGYGGRGYGYSRGGYGPGRGGYRGYGR